MLRTTAADPAITHLARTQQCLATSRQLRAAGLAPSTTARRCAPNGPWQRLLPGVVLLQTGTPDARQRLLAAVLYGAKGLTPLSGGTAVLTGESALALYGVPGATTHRAAVLVPATRSLRNTAYVHVRRTSRWPPTLLVDGIPCVRPVRAASDFAAHERSPDRVRAILTATVQKTSCHPEDLRAELHASRALRNPAARTVLDDLRAGTRSIAEARARDTLRHTNLPHPLWNPTLLTPKGTFLARPDAYWPHAGVALEVDSEEYHLGIAEYRTTLRRRLRLEAHGVDVISAAPALIRDHPQELLAALTTKLHQAKSRPTLPNLIIRPYL
ncbi:hypothetical protein [Streptomyces liangshanensis]|uniref:Transcriptional regulator, AbiEi antitoxin, Type IV TA system n=1 Tax=Streptomyces liangshanensis TaxID=2717324 RepID=A0A6G9H294_9ACTN|nr:hypothetical protein [Streptomyces liangshanensis]QIQ04648.1 hypothetical protein HA039_22270 [Streptomyces liangshanensis]